MSAEEMMDIAGDSTGEGPSEALHERCGDGLEAYDDLTGDVLDPEMMKKARKEEIEYFRQMGVYDKVEIEESFKITGKAPIAVRWVDVNKGDSTSPKYRSRLVAKEFDVKVVGEEARDWTRPCGSAAQTAQGAHPGSGRTRWCKGCVRGHAAHLASQAVEGSLGVKVAGEGPVF